MPEEEDRRAIETPGLSKVVLLDGRRLPEAGLLRPHGGLADGSLNRRPVDGKAGRRREGETDLPGFLGLLPDCSAPGRPLRKRESTPIFETADPVPEAGHPLSCGGGGRMGRTRSGPGGPGPA
jgi:hypothetical protein